jgi:hypothetical protein
MSDHPILFSGPMVRAILDGRKTQTRRVICGRGQRGMPEFLGGRDQIDDPYYWGWAFDDPYSSFETIKRDVDYLYDQGPVSTPCPYGMAGDHLWVKETFSEIPDDGGTIIYRATDPGWDVEKESTCIKWRPSLLMPRAYSRITLTVTGVRVERLNEISERDCIGEGIGENPLRMRYKHLWDEINGKRAPWSSNPWVWVISFSAEKKTLTLSKRCSMLATCAWEKSHK